MKKIKKISLFIIGFYILLLLFSNSKVQATDVVTVTTLQKLQEVMGATEYSTIDGTTLKITDNFTWTISNDIVINIPELTVDFNGKEIKIEKNSESILNISNGKVILKDSQGETGGFYCEGHLITINPNAELMIENGQYIMEKGDSKYGVIQNFGGKLTIKNGDFQCKDGYYIFTIAGGFTTIENGNFEGKGLIIGMPNSNVDPQSLNGKNGSNLVINNGTFISEGMFDMMYFTGFECGCNVKINGGFFKTNKNDIMRIGVGYGSLSLTLNGCTMETSTGSCLNFSCVRDMQIGGYRVDIKNCTLKAGTNVVGAVSAITMSYMVVGDIEMSSLKSNSLIKKLIKNYNEELFMWEKRNNTIEKNIFECTYKKLVFENEKLISATGNPRFSTDELNGNSGENSNNKIEDNDKFTTKTDNKTNIKLEASSGMIPDNTIMNIIEINSGETFNKIKNILSEIKNFKVFDITLKVNDTNIQPNGKVKISIPIPAGFDASRLIVYRVDENNTKTEYQVTVTNGYATFVTDHFSTYVLGEKLKDNNDAKLPQTGEETNTFARWLSIAIALGIFWICSMLFIEHEKKKMTKK